MASSVLMTSLVSIQLLLDPTSSFPSSKPRSWRHSWTYISRQRFCRKLARSLSHTRRERRVARRNRAFYTSHSHRQRPHYPLIIGPWQGRRHPPQSSRLSRLGAIPQTRCRLEKGTRGCKGSHLVRAERFLQGGWRRRRLLRLTRSPLHDHSYCVISRSPITVIIELAT